MFNCTICRKIQPAGLSPIRVVSETRAVNYPYRPKANKVLVMGQIEYRDDPGGSGTEIAREESACPECVANGRQPGAEVLMFR